MVSPVPSVASSECLLVFPCRVCSLSGGWPSCSFPNAHPQLSHEIAEAPWKATSGSCLRFSPPTVGHDCFLFLEHLEHRTFAIALQNPLFNMTER